MDDAFWATHKGLLALSMSGQVFFTKKGREAYAPLFSRHGFSLTPGQTIEQFKDDLQALAKLEAAQKDSRLMAQLNDPATPESEKVYIRRLLGIVPEQKTAVVLSFEAHRKARQS